MSAGLCVVPTSITGLAVLERTPVGDHRGELERMFSTEALGDLLGDRRIEQVNLSRTTRRGTVRGMHYQQIPYCETKFVSCLQGRVFDVAVDIRKDSPTFLRWHGELLTPENHRTLIIPEGCAHGFQALTDDCEMLYLHTAPYRPETEGGLNPRDPLLAIEWPQAITELSVRDASRADLETVFAGIVF
jgi:dTDP-4-dehydrorhamnose 3,5-epimerase